MVSALALPHVLYSFVWLNDRAWRRLFQKNSVHFFACIASLLKGEAAPLSHMFMLLSTCCIASWQSPAISGPETCPGSMLVR